MADPRDVALADASPISDPPFLFLAHDRCLDFLNTRIAVHDRVVDLLATFDDLLEWLVAVAIVTADEAADMRRWWRATTAAEEVLVSARHLRAQLTEMVDQLIDGHSPSPDSVGIVNAILRERAAYEQIALTASGAAAASHALPPPWPQRCQLQRAYTFDCPQDLLAPIAQAAAILVCERDWTRIKRCGNPRCVLHYYDTTKNGSRTWCDTRTCGNRVRVAQHYRRAHTRSAGADRRHGE
jgi:predicted RNA-binding Zn ribbon-like protein